jgi:hypothetical protein
MTGRILVLLETAPAVLKGSSQSVHFVLCTSCKTTIGVTDAPRLDELHTLLNHVLTKINEKNDCSI